MQSPEDAAALLRRYRSGADREIFVTLCPDAKLRPVGITTVSIGYLDAALVHPREVFKPAIAMSDCSVIVGTIIHPVIPSRASRTAR